MCGYMHHNAAGTPEDGGNPQGVNRERKYNGGIDREVSEP